jgi:hypothetical protein
MMGPDTRNVAFTESEREREVRVCRRGKYRTWCEGCK